MSTDIVKVFTSGNSQAVRLPHKYKVNTKEMFIRKEGEAIVLTPRPTSWAGFMEDCEALSDDFSIEGAPLPEDIERDKVS
jgi:antitoxin VapB